jgi:peptidoglycan hydrolase-like protein with peptidoglycan-binding domain
MASGSSSQDGASRSTVALTPTLAPSSTAAPTTTLKAVTTTAKATSTTAASTVITTTTVAGSTTSSIFIPKNFAPVSDLTATPLRAVDNNSGPETKRVQARLVELGFWVSGIDGQYGLATIQAVMAFQKYTHLKATGRVDGYTAALLTSAQFRASASATDGSLVEIDKAKQLLFLVEDGRTIWVFNTSTGSGKHYAEVNKNTGKVEEDDAITPDGHWEITREHAEGWWDGDLGKIYRPKYFHGGIAIHGMNNVPNYPASHGCVRLSLPAMDFIWANGLLPKGTPVWVHS